MGSIDSLPEHSLRRLCNIVTPIGMLGYGLDQDQLDDALSMCVPAGVPTAIILDSGSTDCGPTGLALGKMTTSRQNYKRDLGKILSAAHRYRVPVLISSAGGSGSDEQVEEMFKICEEIAATEGNEAYSVKTITILAGVSKTLVSQRLASGKISGCGSAVPPMLQNDIDECPCIVAQMGPEPFIQAMEATPDFDLVLGGRAYDPSPYVAFAALCLRRAVPEAGEVLSSKLMGGFMHMGKIMECGGICAVPKSGGAMAMVFEDGTFDICPLALQAKCTSTSVAAHTLYEKSRPDLLFGPGGYLDISCAQYEELQDGRTVRVRNAAFQSSAAQNIPYQVKLEGAKTVGFRSMYMGSLGDPILISQIDNFLARVKAYVRQQTDETLGSWQLEFHKYDGKNAPYTSKTKNLPEKVFLIGEALADNQALATTVADTARIATIHGPYQGQKATSGNFGFGICGIKTIELGPCTEFRIYHLMDVQPGEESACEEGLDMNGDVVSTGGTDSRALFRWRCRQLGKGLGEHKAEEREVKMPRWEKAQQKLPKENPKAFSDVPRRLPAGRITLGDVANVLRSKNAGPYEITFDLMFDGNDLYQAVKDTGLLNEHLIETLYGLNPGEVVWCGFFDPARAYKATIRRKRHALPAASGGFLEDDVHGSQQYLPLFHAAFTDQDSEILRKLLEAREGRAA